MHICFFLDSFLFFLVYLASVIALETSQASFSTEFKNKVIIIIQHLH